jgi:hypothetical protein
MIVLRIERKCFKRMKMKNDEDRFGIREHWKFFLGMFYNRMNFIVQCSFLSKID